MTTDLQALSGGLTPEHELFFPKKPDDPEMRESTSIWLFEDNGEFGLPRLGIEAEASTWDDNRQYQANFGLRDGRLLVDIGRGPVPSPLGPDGRPTIFGAGPLTFRMIEPFKTWAVSFDGSPALGTAAQEIAGTFDRTKRVPVRLDAELTMVTPGWVQDNSPQKVAQMSETEADDARSMGIGWRIEHHFRARGTLAIDGQSRSFTASGLRIKRQSVRPLTGFRGHVWQSALFPDGRAFSYITYPPAKDGRTYNSGYIYLKGRWHPARATKIAWLRKVAAEGDDATLELESQLGVTRITGTTLFTHNHFHNLEMVGGRFNLQQTGALYKWDDQTAYGMMERSWTDGALPP